MGEEEALSFVKVKSTTEVQLFYSLLAWSLANSLLVVCGRQRPAAGKWEPAPVFHVSHIGCLFWALPFQSFILDEHVIFIRRDGPIYLFILTFHLPCLVILSLQA